MKTSLDLPDDIAAQLTDKGQDLSRAALEGLAIDAYRMNRIRPSPSQQILSADVRLPSGISRPDRS